MVSNQMSTKGLMPFLQYHRKTIYVSLLALLSLFLLLDYLPACMPIRRGSLRR